MQETENNATAASQDGGPEAREPKARDDAPDGRMRDVESEAECWDEGVPNPQSALKRQLSVDELLNTEENWDQGECSRFDRYQLWAAGCVLLLLET